MSSLFKNKRINWNEDKNNELIKVRGLSFEEVLLQIEEEAVIDIFKHPNKEKYKNQYILIVKIDEYVCAVPFVISKDEIFLKTFYKSRKLNKIYGTNK